ncbi:MAG: family 31 glucosidase [Bifidobacteriaceae bacterium]|jgi:alpha-D-xyloside xylohydrolase|nr:family 31 glucosidase [Bifidobacteriaceae bacterium]
MTAMMEAQAGHEVMLAEAVGPNAIRVRLGRHQIRPNNTGLAAPAAPASAAGADGIGQWNGKNGSLTCGRLRLEVWRDSAGWDPALGLRFVEAETGAELLAEARMHFSWPAGHLLEGDGSGLYRCAIQFAAPPGERLHGLGGRPSGRLDLNNQGFDLVQRNGEVTIPVVMSSAGYGFVWNHPGTGRVEFQAGVTRWSADQAEQIDFIVFWGARPADRLAAYADLTGHAPVMPAWALGLWQSHLRYTHQDQILAVAREYKERGLPLSVIVSDGGHWTAMGDFQFDPAEYPDPAGLVAELRALGCELMVSVWPTVSPLAASYEDWQGAGLLVAADQGSEFPTFMSDKMSGRAIPLALIDSTNPAARAELWRRLKAGYHDLGVRLFWLDADEPERLPGHSRNLSFWAGPGQRVVNRYPLDHARAVTENAPDALVLSRSAWLGQQALGCAVWSGDIPSTWDSLARQVKLGLQMAMSGIPWWTSDIGGFFGGDPSDPAYRELFIRWFQYGAYCPLLRVHGIREPRPQPDVGAPTEIWAFGEEAYPILAGLVRRRQALRPYLEGLAQEAARSGMPPMRPLWVDFPDDPAAWDCDDQFMFGPRYLVAPVTAPGARSRSVYLPSGARWALDGQLHDGGQRLDFDAPLERIPVLERAD